MIEKRGSSFKRPSARFPDAILTCQRGICQLIGLKFINKKSPLAVKVKRARENKLLPLPREIGSFIYSNNRIRGLPSEDSVFDGIIL